MRLQISASTFSFDQPEGFLSFSRSTSQSLFGRADVFEASTPDGKRVLVGSTCPVASSSKMSKHRTLNSRRSRR